MSTPAGGRIVVGVDGSVHATKALAWAVEEAGRRGATVRAVHAWRYPYFGTGLDGVPIPESVLQGVEDGARQTLEQAVDRVPHAGITVERVLVMGPAAQVLVEAAADAELLVVGSRGRGGFAGLLLGSVSQQCAHHAPCPVVIVPAEEDGAA